MKRVILSLAGLLVLYVGAVGYTDTGRVGLMVVGLAMIGLAYLSKGPR